MRALRTLHRWLGLALAVIVAPVAASGGLLLLRDPYHRLVYPVLDAPVAGEQTAARARVLTAIESAATAGAVRAVAFPRPGVNAFHVRYRDGSEAFVDPRTAAVIDRWRWDERPASFLFELHAHLFAGRAGAVVNGVAAGAIVFLVLTGLVLWWPGRRGPFRLSRAVPRDGSAGAARRSHAASGVLVAVPVLLLATTGAGLVFYQPVAAGVSRMLDARVPQEPDARIAPRRAPARDWAAILETLDRALPEGRTALYYPGSVENAVLTFRKQLPGEWHPNGRSYVLVDPYTGRAVQTIDARAQGLGTRLMHAAYPLHAARIGGSWMAATAAAAALGLLWLALSGVRS